MKTLNPAKRLIALKRKCRDGPCGYPKKYIKKRMATRAIPTSYFPV